MRSHLVQMGHKAVEQVELSMKALIEGDTALAASVRSHDDDLDDLEMEIDAEAISYISLRAPVARELRLVVVGMKAAQDLERVGDEAANIAKRVKRLRGPLPAGPTRDEFRRMADMVIQMLQEALESFLQGDEAKALSICRRDEEVDQLEKKIYKEITSRMSEHPDFFTAGIELLFVTRSLERMADHSTNIAEEVIYLLRGKDVRHSSAVKAKS